jgi:hypothetical protein
MTAPLREQLKNDAATTLNGAINNSVTSVVVTDGSVFPSVGNFRILVESEIMLCTARSSNTLTVLRGQEGTTAASHGDGLGVLHTLTAGSHTRIIQDNDTRNTSQPPLGVIDNGSGGLLTSSDFTWDNQGGATVSDDNGTILLAAPSASGENCRVLYRTAPSAPYTVIGGFQAHIRRNDGVPNWGLVFRKNSDQKLHACGFSSDSFGACRFTMYNFNSPTSFSSTQYGREDCTFIGEVFWVKLEDDNTNLKFSVSFDGVEWLLLKSVSRTGFMSGGPDRIGFYLNNAASTNATAKIRLVHWSTF